MNQQKFARNLLAGGIAVATAVAGLLTAGGPAFADPVNPYVAVGSDTIQDVDNALATAIGFGLIGSYDAVSPIDGSTHGLINPKSGCIVTRANGSGEGVTTLRQAWDNSATAPAAYSSLETNLPAHGCVDIARSSGAPSTSAQSPTGVWVYVPLALDAVAVASAHYGDAAATDYNAFTLADWQGLYSGTATTVTKNGHTYDATCFATCSNGNTPIHLYIPQSGSGTRSFWQTQMGGAFGANAHDHAFNFTTGNTFDGVSVEEHDGTVLGGKAGYYAGDPNGVAPFSIAQWVSQRNGHNDRRHGAHLSIMSATNPLTGNFPTVETGNLNTSFTVRREVYSVVEYSRAVDSTSANFDPQLNALVVSPTGGTAALMCSNNVTLLQYGFGLLSASPLGHKCGQIDNALRAFANDVTVHP